MTQDFSKMNVKEAREYLKKYSTKRLMSIIIDNYNYHDDVDMIETELSKCKKTDLLDCILSIEYIDYLREKTDKFNKDFNFYNAVIKYANTVIIALKLSKDYYFIDNVYAAEADTLDFIRIIKDNKELIITCEKNDTYESILIKIEKELNNYNNCFSNLIINLNKNNIAYNINDLLETLDSENIDMYEHILETELYKTELEIKDFEDIKYIYNNDLEKYI